MPASAFLDPTSPPTAYEVKAALGERASLWGSLVAFVEGPCGARALWVHEGRTTGWALRCVRAGRPFVVLYPDGTWIYARPETDADVADVRRLLAVKLPATVRARVDVR